MIALAVDSSGEVLSVSLGRDAESYHFELDAGLRHSERLMEVVDAVLSIARADPAGLDMVACMKGPGSFTGLRMGMATAKGMAASLGIPLYAVSTLDCMAAPRSAWPGIVLPLIDAKKNRWYAALFKGGARISDDMDAGAEALAEAVRAAGSEAVLVTGPDAPRAAAALSAILADRSVVVDPSGRRAAAGALLALAVERFERGDPGEADEVGLSYLRKSEAETTRERAAGGDSPE